ncbi:AraC family transcriptional regulator [Paenibacillus spongiae]|uniref:DNA-binding transcriptional regulator n=1 Tax=Paenibacillus spongiae TaxID=2909671 RepID=A0ABY5S6W7_9BACL|nr:DNA-binding transcriptional regulator [Paenibacillus spongiae]UVI28290.1 DNA-binding transcriptional regulator [Paenibacillus spongiae]
MRFLEELSIAGGGTRNRQIALLIETSNEYGRGLLRGIHSYIRENKPWSIYMGEQSRSQTDLTWLSGWQGDGVIARIENEEIAAHIRRLGLPTVDLSASRLIPELHCVETDDQSIARLAVQHLMERGFKHFAFCGEERFTWSRQRQNHYVRLLEEYGLSCSINSLVYGKTWNEERRDMAAWVKSLPKPAGILVCYDILGQKLLEACRLAGVAVPDEVGIIGVDNDELLCNLSDPPLSSIVPNALETGYRAAALLEQMMNGERIESGITSIQPLDIVTRMSTDVVAVEDKLVADAVRFIRGKIYEDINVGDLLKVFPVSRRSFEGRFERSLGRTPHAFIVEMKVKLIKEFLTETELNLSMIAERIGFKHLEYMSVLFKRETGMTPNDYRQKAKGKTD